MHVRRAEIYDLEAVLALKSALYAEEAERFPDASPRGYVGHIEVIRATIDQLGSGGHIIALLEDDNITCGYMTLRLGPVWGYSPDTASITGAYLAPAYRQDGASFLRLYQFLRKTPEFKSFKRVQIQVTEGNLVMENLLKDRAREICRTYELEVPGHG